MEERKQLNAEVFSGLGEAYDIDLLSRWCLGRHGEEVCLGKLEVAVDLRYHGLYLWVSEVSHACGGDSVMRFRRGVLPLPAGRAAGVRDAVLVEKRILHVGEG